MQAVVLDLFGTLVAALRAKRLRLGILSDASAEIVAAWPSSPLAALVDAAVFSCTAGAVRPDQRLYGRICAELDATSDQVLYVGDAGGDELRGALAAGMAAVAVRRRGPTNALAFGDTEWSGPVLDTAEQVPAYLAGTRMKAWEIRNGDLGLHDVGSAHPREGETVVRVSHVGICGSDLPKLRLPNGFALPEP